MENTTMRLTAENVDKVLKNCLYKPDEIANGKLPENCVKIEGLAHAFGFHPERLKENKTHIEEMLRELPEEIKDGCSFLNLCMRKDDFHWGEHINVEALIVLGMAIDKLEYMLPRRFWNRLPGGLPYIAVKK